MMCKNPYMQGVLAYGCGQCNPCRINRRRLWTHRMMLESRLHSESCFLTLTYAKEYLPKGATLVPKHTTNMLKRLRKHFAPMALRYFLVGEYGDISQRPHYHVALFGLGPVRIAGSMLAPGRFDVYAGEPLRSIWGMGNVYAGSLTNDSAQYVAGYVTKKMTSKDDIRLGNRHPEFARMSTHPGIGARAMVDVAAALDNDHGMELIHKNGDVPMALSHGRKQMPLGRYLRRELRGAMGFQSKDPPRSGIKRYAFEMRFLQEEARKVEANTSKGCKEVLLNLNKQKVLNMETRLKIHQGDKII